MDEEFKSFYRQAILPEVEQCRELRNKIEQKLSGTSKSLIIQTTATFAIIVTIAFVVEVYFILFISLAIAFHGYSEYEKERSKLVTQLRKRTTEIYKKSVFLPIFRYYYPDIKYLPAEFFSLKTIQKSLLFSPPPTTKSGEDYLGLTAGETRLRFNEISTKGFHGVFGIATFNKNFSKRTFVFSKELDGNRRSIGLSSLENVQKAEMDSISFMEIFDVYTEDQIEARYILTPSLMERLLEYEKMIGMGISVSFIDNLMYFKIAVPENLFDIDIMNVSNEYAFIVRHTRHFLAITGIVEALNLNTRIWTKK